MRQFCTQITIEGQQVQPNGKPRLVAQVHDDPRFPEGSTIITGPVVAEIQVAEGRYYLTHDWNYLVPAVAP